MSNVIICPHDRNMKMIKDKVVDIMKATKYRSYSSDTSTNKCLELSEEVLNTFEVPGLLKHEWNKTKCSEAHRIFALML